jgi:sugar fermentation stimulation protein A
MEWPRKLVQGKFIKRYKRFFADVELDGKLVVAHVANTGSLKSALRPESGQKCLLSPAADPERKLKFSLEAVQSTEGTWIGVNTSHPNKLAKEAFEKATFRHWKGFHQLKSEVKINAETRLDLLLESKAGKKHYVEIKNVTMKTEKAAQFPDSVTERGQKHLRELMKLVQEGHSAEILFTVQREDCDHFSPAESIDPEYARLLREAKKAGVLISVFVVQVTPHQIVLTDQALKVHL